MINQLRVPEILAPCGSYEILEAAVHAGASACYVGGHKFGARAYAENFDNDSILRAIEFTHLHGCRLYLTVNTLFKDNEINMLYDYLLPLYQHGLDAVIVQDFGVFLFIRRMFPDIKIHCSTQMNITSVYGAALMKQQGASRIVAARELSLERIKEIKSELDIEIEAFVHGAMCYSYSGQCLMSSFAGTRSGNRGRCAQPCRKKYNGEYLLSMKDMCTLEHIPALIDAGIDSFKIEGRMKNEYYVASAVSAYRELAHDYVNGAFSVKKANDLKFKLANIYNRGGFCGGYFFTHNAADMIARKRPNHQGVPIGRLVAAGEGKTAIRLTQKLYQQDVLEVLLTDDTVLNLTSGVCGEAGEVVTLNAPRTREIVRGQMIYRIKSRYVEKEISCAETVKMPLNGCLEARLGKTISFTVTCNINGACFSGSAAGDVAEKSLKHGADAAAIREKLSQVGNTDYYFEAIELQVDENAFVPHGVLKQLRREAISRLEADIISSHYREVLEEGNACLQAVREEITNINGNCNTACVRDEAAYDNLHVSVLTYEQLCAVIKYDCVRAVYMDICLFENAMVKALIDSGGFVDKKIYLCLPDVVENDFKITKYLPNSEISGIYIKNIDGLASVLTFDKNLLCGLDLVLAPSVYAYNGLSKTFLMSLYDRLSMELPMELNQNELEALTEGMPAHNYGIVMYGHTRVMLSNQCIKKTTGKCDHKADITKITDEAGNTFFCYSDCMGCTNRIYNRDALNLFGRLDPDTLKKLKVNRLRLDFTVEDEKRVSGVLDYAADVLKKGKSSKKLEFPITTGHLNRGVE
ncbi:MAG: U32 family peptidase [Clostridium sp.]|nr:U32 family peptidase [Clostridium sp.]